MAGAMGLSMYSSVGDLVPGSSVGVCVGGGVWFVGIVVLPMGLQTPSTPSDLSLTPLLGTPCSVQWLHIASVFVRHWQGLSGDSHISSY